MFTLYHGPGTCSLAVKAALTLTGKSFTTESLNMAEGEHLSADFKIISPLGKVPALRLNQEDDAEVLTEGSAILLYLASRFPEANLMPATGTVAYGAALKWMQVLYATIHPHWGRLFFPERYGNDANSIRDAAETEIHTLYGLIEAQLANHPYVAGDALTLADLYLMVSIHWQGALQQPLSGQFPAITAYQQRMYNEPTIGQLYRDEFGA